MDDPGRTASLEADLRDSRHALEVLTEVSRAIAEASLDLSAVYETVVQSLVAAMTDVCAIWVLSRDGENLTLRAVDHRYPEGRALYEPLLGTHVHPGGGISGQALRTRRVASAADLDPAVVMAALERPAERALVAEFPPRHIAAAPLIARGEMLGVVAISRLADGAPYSATDLWLLEEVASRAALAIANAVDVAGERRARGQLAVLARASEALSRSLDWDVTLHAVVDLALPLLGDFGFFDVVEPDGSVRRLPLAKGDPRRQAILDQTRWVRSERTDLNLCALSSGATALHGDIGEAWLRAVAVAPEHYAVMADLAFTSMLTVPLRYEERVLGALTLFHTLESGRRYDDEDVYLAEELARRAAAAVENARLFREAQLAIAVRDDFLSIAGHELRTPLTALQLQLGTLEREVAREEPRAVVESRLGKVTRQATRLSGLVDDLLDISRISAGKLRLERTPVDLGEVVGEVLARAGDDLARAGCALEHDLATGVLGEWDRLRVEQILTNLLSNASKYGKGKPIAVQVARDGDVARLTVRDHGIGISPEHQERIFQRFERAVSSRHFGGLGLGLWIVRQLVEAHGGTIRVESAPAQGARFDVELPVTTPPAPAR